MNTLVVMPNDYYKIGVNCGLKLFNSPNEYPVNDVSNYYKELTSVWLKFALAYKSF